MRHLSLECRFESVICRFQNANTKAKCKGKGKCIGKWFLCPKCGIYLLNAALKRDLSISECKYKGKMQRQRQMHRKMVFMPLNAAFISWMPLWSVIFRFQNANTKAKCKCKGKCIKKWFLCPKCCIYLLNAALKRDFVDFRMQIQRQNAKAKAKCIGKSFLCPKCSIISWLTLWSVIFRFQNANTKAKCNAKANG